MRRVKYFWGLPNQLVEVELYFKYKNNCNGMQFTPKWWFSVLLALLTETSKEFYSWFNALIWARVDKYLSTGSQDKQFYNWQW